MDILNITFFVKKSQVSEKIILKNTVKEIGEKWTEGRTVFPWILNGHVNSERQIKKRMSNYISNLRRRYHAISKECNYDGHFSFYTARITAATVLANKGANMKAVQTELDHSSLAMTSKYIRRIDINLMHDTFAML